MSRFSDPAAQWNNQVHEKDTTDRARLRVGGPQQLLLPDRAQEIENHQLVVGREQLHHPDRTQEGENHQLGDREQPLRCHFI